ncbi:Hypothetical protein CAP_8705 [Chondromyces apiculatus DSM 436]|uniref:Uncharacterized protein n=1 Tax=Chondromyces apiculatus DSM 436 TaxID=1192034 RepID=A0A017TFB5_9BACT|nr:Hypothetical protein CAP_8705 [Chondromyces apiculatus DSM 436]
MLLKDGDALGPSEGHHPPNEGEIDPVLAASCRCCMERRLTFLPSATPLLVRL